MVNIYARCIRYVGYKTNKESYVSLAVPKLHDKTLIVLQEKMPDHALLMCSITSNFIILWPKNNEATEIYELDIEVANKTVIDDPDKVTDLLQRVSRKVEQKAVQVSFKDYRVVDSSHINKLHSLLEATYCQSEVSDVLGDKAPIIHGTLALPSNFVLAHDFNKTVRAGVFNPEMGMKYLKDKLEVKADEKLWELEGYRLYRSLMTLDGFHNTYGRFMVNLNDESIDPAVLVANCAIVWTGAYTDMVYLEIDEDIHRDIIATSEGKLKPCLVGIPREYYERMLTIINTYIEFQ